VILNYQEVFEEGDVGIYFRFPHLADGDDSFKLCSELDYLKWTKPMRIDSWSVHAERLKKDLDPGLVHPGSPMLQLKLNIPIQWRGEDSSWFTTPNSITLRYTGHPCGDDIMTFNIDSAYENTKEEAKMSRYILTNEDRPPLCEDPGYEQVNISL